MTMQTSMLKRRRPAQHAPRPGNVTLPNPESLNNARPATPAETALFKRLATDWRPISKSNAVEMERRRRVREQIDTILAEAHLGRRAEKFVLEGFLEERYAVQRTVPDDAPLPRRRSYT